MAARRAPMADGVLTFAMEADPAPQVGLFDVARKAWDEEGKPGRPRFVAGIFFALGPDAGNRALEALNRYYSAFPPDQAALIAKSVTTTSERAVARRSPASPRRAPTSSSCARSSPRATRSTGWPTSWPAPPDRPHRSRHPPWPSYAGTPLHHPYQLVYVHHCRAIGYGTVRCRSGTGPRGLTEGDV